tara:strand:- start:766 stop:1179 length:414 start_codon:yes stop_codon:yes gene_type:complete
MLNGKHIRVLIAKIGLDGHDRGAKIVARALLDAGMEVIYTGIRQTPEMIAETALQEDVDVIGISILSGAHVVLISDLIDHLNRNGMPKPILIVGGIIPENDHPVLHGMGIDIIFGPGTATPSVVDSIVKAINDRPLP